MLALTFGLTTPEDRVATARGNKAVKLNALAKAAKLTYPFHRVLLRAYKREKLLELWAMNAKGPMKLVETYPIAAASGTWGPKRREGDSQVPEGFYHIDVFNPQSRFHLSIRVDYPNASDRILSDREHPGGDIYIHGSRVSIGCLAITDDKIEEVYLACLDSKTASKSKPAVLILPFKRGFVAQKDWPEDFRSLWKDLFVIDAWFDKNHRIPKVGVGSRGAYYLMP